MKSKVFFFVLAMVFANKIIDAQTSLNYFEPTPIRTTQEGYKKFAKTIQIEAGKKAGIWGVNPDAVIFIASYQSGGGIMRRGFNFGWVKAIPAITAYEKFKDAEDGLLICTSDRRGIEGIAMALHFAKKELGLTKKVLPVEQWVEILCGPDGDLSENSETAKLVFNALFNRAVKIPEINNKPRNIQQKDLVISTREIINQAVEEVPDKIANPEGKLINVKPTGSEKFEPKE